MIVFPVSLDNLATPFVCILSGFLQQWFGPKPILMFACFPYMCGWGAAAIAGHLQSVALLYSSRWVNAYSLNKVVLFYVCSFTRVGQ